VQSGLRRQRVREDYLVKLNQVTVPSTDVVRAVEFYQQLGLVLIVLSLPKYARFACPDDDATFSVHHYEELAIGEKPVVYFECENLDGVVEELKRKGVEFDSEPRDQPWLWREAYLRDPDGNVICLYFAGNNRLNPPWRLNSEA
jgi:catechol 2,3-dioxygenase-like lactoylglutathione lyase family enzyme